MLITAALSVRAQLSEGGQPVGLQEAQRQPALELPVLDVEEVLAEDRQHPEYNRFAAPVAVQIGKSDFSWQEVEGGRLGLLRMRSKQAKALALMFRNFRLAPGARLLVYRPDGRQVLGAYTERNNRPEETFLAGFVEGEEMVLELFEPVGREESRLEIFRILYAYHPPRVQSDYPFQVYQGQGFGDALPCHVNVNCPEAADWQDEKRGVVRILRVFEEGAGWCTGSLINNTAQDARPLVLSAFHCQQDLTPMYNMWRFDFAYEFPSCAGDTSEPSFVALLGCTPLSMRQESDFLLLELQSDIPLGFQARFNGWNRDPAFVPSESAIIHHPFGDVKKFSLDDDAAIIFAGPINWSNNVTTPPNHHFRSILDVGTIESGSSGAPYFDVEGRIIGQLHGGLADCDQFVTYHGRLSRSWDQGSGPESRLRDWLDPLNSGALQVEALETPTVIPQFSGRVEDIYGNGIAQVQVILDGAQPDTVLTDADGLFSFQNIPVGAGRSLRFEKNIHPRNGVSTFDLLRIQQHILLFDPLVYNWEFFAADANNDGAVSTFDLLDLQQVVLQLSAKMPNHTSWQFFPAELQLDLWPVQLPEAVVTGLKTGDLNGDADPTK